MRVDDIPLLSMIKGRLGYLSAREKVIAENVANADTPGFTPRDVKAPDFAEVLGAARGKGAAQAAPLAMTQAGHMAGPSGVRAGGKTWKAEMSPDSETRMDGNGVVLEEQMLKMAESRMAYDAAISFYQKSMNMLRLASRAPGR